MKKTTAYMLLMFLAIQQIKAQGHTNLISTKKSEAIAAVPDAPAFNALGAQPSNILRPSDIKTLSLHIAPFIQGGKFAIPKEFALEVSPAAFIYRDRRINIEDYRQRKIFLAYNTTISLGTGLDSVNGLNKIAVGWRTTFINRGDKFLNNEHRNHIDNILMVSSGKFATAWQNFKDAHATQFASADSKDEDGNYDPLFNYDDELLQGIDSTLVKQFWAEYQQQTDVQALIDAADRRFEETHWNALRLDAAAAFVATAEDSMGKNLKPAQIKGWLNLSLPIQQHGQVVVGAYGSGGFEDEEKDSVGHITNRPSWETSLAMRFYAGVNKYKFLAEGQIGIRQDSHIKPYATNNFFIGTEIGIYNLAWVSLYGGLKDAGMKQDGRNMTRGYLRFDLKFNIPDWAKFRT